MAIGSGGLYALSGAKALFDIEGLDAETIARKSMYVPEPFQKAFFFVLICGIGKLQLHFVCLRMTTL